MVALLRADTARQGRRGFGRRAMQYCCTANVSSTRFASHRHKHHAAAIDATSLAPDCLAERRQFAATVLRVSFGSRYRHIAASLLLRRLRLSRACGHCVIVRPSRIALRHLGLLVRASSVLSAASIRRRFACGLQSRYWRRDGSSNLFCVRLLTDPPSWSLIFPNPPFVGVLAYRRVGGAGIAGSMRGPPIHDATAREARLYAIGLCEQRLRAGDTSYTDVACSDGKIVEAKVRHDLHRGTGAAVEHHQRVNRFALQ